MSGRACLSIKGERSRPCYGIDLIVCEHRTELAPGEVGRVDQRVQGDRGQMREEGRGCEEGKEIEGEGCEEGNEIEGERGGRGV